MKIRKSKIQNPPTIMLMVVGALVWMLSCGNVATAGYSESAHGDTTNGINRPGTECPTGTPCQQETAPTAMTPLTSLFMV